MILFRRETKAFFAVSFFLLVSFLFSAAQAGEATLEDIVVAIGRDHCLLSFRVANCCTEEMKKAIDNGIDTTFTFYVKLYRIRDIWWDKEIADLKVSHSIHFDSLKKVYSVRLSEKDDKVIVLEDFEKAKKVMSEVMGLGVTDLENLQKGSRYQVRMMAELDKITLPFYLHYVFFFLSLWDFETDWHTVDFKYE
jgi:hypothetical protein